MCEQGLGDTFMFARFVPMVVARGFDVTFAVQRSQVALMQQSFPTAKGGHGRRTRGNDLRLLGSAVVTARRARHHAGQPAGAVTLSADSRGRCGRLARTVGRSRGRRSNATKPRGHSSAVRGEPAERRALRIGPLSGKASSPGRTTRWQSAQSRSALISGWSKRIRSHLGIAANTAHHHSPPQR